MGQSETEESIFLSSYCFTQPNITAVSLLTQHSFWNATTIYIYIHEISNDLQTVCYW